MIRPNNALSAERKKPRPLKSAVRLLMKFTMSMIFFSTFFSTILFGQYSEARWHEFVKSDYLFVLDKGDTISVYYDSKLPSDVFLIIDGKKWVIRIDEKEVIMPVGKFYPKGKIYLHDTSSTPSIDRASGFSWNDPKIEFSFYNFLFRSPRFKKNQIKFWTGTKWCKMYSVNKHNMYMLKND